MADRANYEYPIHLHEGIGVELEYMIVDRDTLDVKPVADEVLRAVAGEYTSDVEPDGEDGIIGWSNELVLHVIELKTIQPVRSLDGLAELFQSHVGRINDILEPMNARLMPGAMHPWMDPDREMRLWPHDFSPIYEAFDRIFSCKGHGWANLQSTHINLAFGNDEEFGRLHAAMRLLLPIMPAIAASSPIYSGHATGELDNRLEVYRHNARRVPSVSGLVIPEPYFTRDSYESELLAGIYRDIAPLDVDGILQQEWLNARGCIARFDRGSIEIRVLDIQECPLADLAICHAIIDTLRAMSDERWMPLADQQRFLAIDLHRILLETIRYAELAVIDNAEYLRAFGCDQLTITAGDLWQHILDQLADDGAVASTGRAALQHILDHGTLATRIMRSLNPDGSRPAMRNSYERLCDCLEAGSLY